MLDVAVFLSVMFEFPSQHTVFSLQDAFVLWDTFGFPLDLTQVLRSFVVISKGMRFFITFILGFQLMAEERGLLVDVDGFNKAMEEARERSRSAQNKVFQLFFLFLDVKIK